MDKTYRNEFRRRYLIEALPDPLTRASRHLQLFDNYTDKNESNRTNVDVNYDLLINMKVNKWLAASFFLTIIYDNDITIADLDEEGNPTGAAGPRTQVKEGIGIGITYKFGNELK